MIVVDVLYRDVQTELIADKLSLSKKDVDLILRSYVSYLREKINSGNTVKVLNICYIKNKENDKELRETLGYIATEISNVIKVGSTTIRRVLSTLEEFIISDIAEGKAYSIRGLVRIRCEEVNGEKRVRIKKSTKDNGKPIHIVTLDSFRKRVGDYIARQNA